MEQGEVKALMEKFQNDESPNSRFKPAIPEKPKSIPPLSPTAKISNPLLASINSAMENRLAPRVVFKDDKKNRQFPQPETSLVKAKPIMLDKNQKKEADLIKQALKDRKIVATSPVTPVSEQKPKPDTVQKSPVLKTPVKALTPTFNKREKDEKEKTHSSEWDVPATPVFNYSDSTISTPDKVKATVNQPVDSRAFVPPVSANPIISAPIVLPRRVSALKPPVLNNPEPDSVSQNGPQLEKPRPEIPIRHNFNVPSQTADIFPHGLPDEPTSIPNTHYILDIPPPIIPEDFSDGGASFIDKSASVSSENSFPGFSLSVTPVTSSPAVSRKASPIPAIETPGSDSVFTFSPLPAFSPLPKFSEFPSCVESPAVNKVNEYQKGIEKPLQVPLSSSPNTNSVVSALARAEEMAPVKHSSCDRLLTLLEKAKRKSTVGSEISTHDTLPVVETNLLSNDPLESSAHDETFSYIGTPNVLETRDMPPVGYEGKAEEAIMTYNNTRPYESALDDEEHSKSSPGPKMVFVQRPLVPPPPPPRKPQPNVINGELKAEKPPQMPNTDRQSSILPSQPLGYSEVIIPAPSDFTSGDLPYEDSEVWDPSEVVGSQAEALDYENHGPSVHEEAFLEHFNAENQTPSIDTTDNGIPRTNEDFDTGSNSPPSPSGNQINYSGIELEDLPANKKGKTKKLRKGSPMNPYADTSSDIYSQTEEVPRKTLFSKKNSVSDEKEVKSKEKQKQKDKEKEKEKKELKEKEKKEQKEKEKKEQKEKEKEKELKEKEKKEQKEKEKKKELKEKEIKEKEKDKKELKEKEREKREQKEKEKKENEIKKKFRITGEEEALYQAKVTETTKGRKDDLAIKAGEIVSIIRTTDCPKGKWLARDNTNKYGYIPVESVELNIQEMMGLKNKAANRTSVNGIIDPEDSTDLSRSSQHYILNQESFDDDSEEWGDDDDTVFPPAHTTDLELNQRVVFPDIEPVPALAGHTDRSDNHSGQEAIHKLSTFFAQPKASTLQSDTTLKPETDLQLLPPPDLYADISVG